MDWNVPEEEEAVLEEWAYHCFKAHELGKLVSAKEVDKRQSERMVKVGLWCCLDDPSLHPSIKKVLLMLERTVECRYISQSFQIRLLLLVSCKMCVRF